MLIRDPYFLETEMHSGITYSQFCANFITFRSNYTKMTYVKSNDVLNITDQTYKFIIIQIYIYL